MSDGRGSRFEDRGSRIEVRGSALDRAIDGAVREMLDVEPPAGFHGRVLTRLTASGSQLPASPFRVPVFGFGFAAAVAIVVLAILLPREKVDPRPAPPLAVATNQEPRTVVPSTVLPQSPGAAEVPRSAVAGRAPGRVADRTVAAAAFEAASADAGPAIQPLKTIDPIHIAPLTQESIAPDEIMLRPLSAITEVQIAPLSLPERRD